MSNQDTEMSETVYVAILDPDTFEHKTTETQDLIKLIKVAEQIPVYDAQSTAVVCDDVPKDLQDLYRLYLVMLYSKKPIVTGAFTNNTVHHMINMLAIVLLKSMAYVGWVCHLGLFWVDSKFII